MNPTRIKAGQVRKGARRKGAEQPSTVIDGQVVYVRAAVVPIVDHLVKNEGKTLTLEQIGKAAKIKPQTVRFYLVDARNAFAQAGRTLTTVYGGSVRLEIPGDE